MAPNLDKLWQNLKMSPSEVRGARPMAPSQPPAGSLQFQGAKDFQRDVRQSEGEQPKDLLPTCRNRGALGEIRTLSTMQIFFPVGETAERAWPKIF